MRVVSEQPVGDQHVVPDCQLSGVSLPAPRYPVTIVIGTFPPGTSSSSSLTRAVAPSALTSTKAGGSSSSIFRLIFGLLLGRRVRSAVSRQRVGVARLAGILVQSGFACRTRGNRE
jgi:hypothetical protein